MTFPGWTIIPELKQRKKRQVFFARKPALNFKPSTEIQRARLKILSFVACRHRKNLDVCATLDDTSRGWKEEQRFHENAGIKVAAGRVTAVTRRGGSPVHPDRRSAIGSHATPKTAIFIPSGELEEVMGHSLKSLALPRIGTGAVSWPCW